jgi:hypothetical protein
MGRILSNRQVTATKVEVTEGTAETLAAADANVQILEPAKWEPNVAMFERKLLDISYSNFKQIPGTRLAQISFKVENKGSGTAGTAPAIGKLLRACGFLETIVAVTSATYTPVSALASVPTVTVAIYQDGIRKQLKGARGNVKYDAVDGQPSMFEFTFIGIYDAVSDQTLLTPSGVETTVPIATLTAQFSVQSFSAFVSKISFDMGNTLTPRSDINTAAGYISTLLTARSPKGTFDPELELVATHDWYGRMLAGTTGVLTWRHTGTAGNICIFNIPVCQYVKVNDGDRDGISIAPIEFLMVRSAAAGNDELSIAYT